MTQRLFRSTRTGDLELFSSDPGPNSGWELVGTLAPAVQASREQLLHQQEQLAQRERKQYGQLLKTRDTLDELACKLDVLEALAPYDPDNYVATPERILAAQLRAEGKLAVPCAPPPQPKQGVKLTAEEAIELFEKVQRQRRGEV